MHVAIFSILLLLITSCSKGGDSNKIESPIIQEASISAIIGQEEDILLDLGSIPYGKSKDGLIAIKQNQIATLSPSALVNGKLTLDESSSPELSILSQSGCTSIKRSTGTCNIKIRANANGLADGSLLQGSILVHIDPLTEEETRINITAIVGEAPVIENPTALVSSTSSSLDFGSLSISDSPKDLIVTYRATSLLQASDSHQVVVNSPFVIQSLSADRCSLKNISRNSTCTVKVRLDPSLVTTNGVVSGNISFAGLSIPLSSTISGNPDVGQPAQSQLAWIYNGSEISALDLGTLLSSNVPLKFNLYLKNKGNANETVNVTIAGSGFTIINRCQNKELLPNAQCSLEVRPESSVGTKSVSISVDGQPSLSLPLSLVVTTTVEPVVTYVAVDTTAPCSSLNLPICGGTQYIARNYLCEQYIDGIKNNDYVSNQEHCSLEVSSPVSCPSQEGTFSESILNGQKNISCDLGSSEQNISYVCNENFILVGTTCESTDPEEPLLPLIAINSNSTNSLILKTNQITTLSVQSNMTDVLWYKGNDCQPSNQLTPMASFSPYSAFMIPYPSIEIGINYVSAKGKVNGVDTLCGVSSFTYELPDTTFPLLSISMDEFTTFANKMPEIDLVLSDDVGLSHFSYTVSSIEYNSSLSNEYEIENDPNKYYWAMTNFDDSPLSINDKIVNELFNNSLYEIISNQDRLFPYNEQVFVLFKLCDTSYNCSYESMALTSTQNIPNSIDFYFSQNLTATNESQRDLIKFSVSPSKLNQLRFGDYNQHNKLDYINARGNLLSISTPLVFDASGSNGNYLSSNNYIDETFCSSIGGTMNSFNICITTEKQQCIDSGNIYVEIYSGVEVSYRNSDPYDTFYHQSCRSDQFAIGYTGLNVASYPLLSIKQKLAYDSMKFFDDNCIVGEYGTMSCDFPEGSPLVLGENQNATKFLIATNGGDVVELNALTGEIIDVANFTSLNYMNQINFTEVSPFEGDGFYGEANTNSYLYSGLKFTINSSTNFYMNQSPIIKIDGESTKGLFFTNKNTLFATGKLDVDSFTLNTTNKLYQKDLRKTPFISITGRTIIEAGTVTPNGNTFNKPIYWYHDIDEDAIGHQVTPSIGTYSGFNDNNAFKCGNYIYVIGSSANGTQTNMRVQSMSDSSSIIVSFNGNQNFPGFKKEQICDNGKLYWIGANGSGLALYIYDPTIQNTSTNPRIISIANSDSNLSPEFMNLAISNDYVYYFTFRESNLLYSFERVNKTTFVKQSLGLSFSLFDNLALLSAMTVDYISNKLYLNITKVQDNNLSVILEYDPSLAINYSLSMGNSLSNLNGTGSGGGQYSLNNPKVLKAFPDGTNMSNNNVMAIVQNQLIYQINSSMFANYDHAVRAMNLSTKEDKLLIPMNSGGSFQSLTKIKSYGSNVFLLTNDNNRGVRLEWVNLNQSSGVGSPGNPLNIRSFGTPTPTHPMIFDVFAK